MVSCLTAGKKRDCGRIITAEVIRLQRRFRNGRESIILGKDLMKRNEKVAKRLQKSPPFLFLRVSFFGDITLFFLFFFFSIFFFCEAHAGV